VILAPVSKTNGMICLSTKYSLFPYDTLVRCNTLMKLPATMTKVYTLVSLYLLTLPPQMGMDTQASHSQGPLLRLTPRETSSLR
jgi:hypothetical protein